MLIFIDESGSFSGFDRANAPSLAAVGALSIPHGAMEKLTRKYETLRSRFPLDRGEVKGRSLSEAQVAAVIDLLRRNNAVLEITIADVGAHSDAGVRSYRDQLAILMESRKPRFNSITQTEVEQAVIQIRKSSPQLFLQAIVTMGVLEKVIVHTPMYFAQRQPKELEVFEWVVDAKDRDKTTDWEKWWSSYCCGVLATRSKLRPGAALECADYSHFERSFGARRDGEEGTDLKLLMSNFRFSSTSEFGLELVDIATNAVRRALTGNLTEAGWREIPRIMIHRPEHYVGVMHLDGAARPPPEPTYARVLRQFTVGGRNMIAPSFLKMAAEQQ